MSSKRLQLRWSHLVEGSLLLLLDCSGYGAQLVEQTLVATSIKARQGDISFFAATVGKMTVFLLLSASGSRQRFRVEDCLAESVT